MKIEEESFFFDDPNTTGIESKTLKEIFDKFKLKGWIPIYGRPDKPNSQLETLKIGEDYSISPDLPEEEIGYFLEQYAAMPTIRISESTDVLYPVKKEDSGGFRVSRAVLEPDDSISFLRMDLKNTYIHVRYIFGRIKINGKEGKLPNPELIFNYDAFNRILPNLNDISSLLKTD